MLSVRVVPELITIEFPEAIRSRKVVTRSRARPTGKFPSWKMDRMLQWESVAELNAMRLLDAAPSVRSFAEQPVVIRYSLDGERRIHYPDLLVKRDDGLKEFWEVKSAKDAAREEVVARTTLLQAALPTYGYEYRMVYPAAFANGAMWQLFYPGSVLWRGRSGSR